MSYEEYRDLFLKAQENTEAPYICFSFDLKNSKKMGDEERYLAQIKTFETINVLTKRILDLEKKEDRQILLQNNEIKIARNVVKDRPEITYYGNPCFTAGDSFHFYVYKNSLSVKEIISLFKASLNKTENYNTYHFAYGKFETTNYRTRNRKYYVGFVIAELTDNKENRKCDISMDNIQEF